MAKRKYNLNGREMLVIDNRGLVDYDDYYISLGKSFERRSDITTKYISLQNNEISENEPSINLSVQYCNYLDMLKNSDIESYNKKRTLFKNYSNELYEEEKIHLDEIKTLLSKGYPFDVELKKYGFYITNIDSNYYQYNRYFELVPITIEQLAEIKIKVSKKKEIAEQITSNRHHGR